MLDAATSKLFLLKTKMRASAEKKHIVYTSYSDSNIAHQAITRADGSLHEVPSLPNQTELLKCSDCGRSFNHESLSRHRKICRKVFKSKRKIFDSSKIRLGAIDEHFQAIPAGSKKLKVNTPSSGIKTSWRVKSAQFRSAIGSLRKENTVGYTGGNSDLNPGPVDPNRVNCPHCGRGFNQDAAKRHVSVCQKLFSSKPGGGRLLRGEGSLSHSTMKRIVPSVIGAAQRFFK